MNPMHHRGETSRRNYEMSELVTQEVTTESDFDNSIIHSPFHSKPEILIEEGQVSIPDKVEENAITTEDTATNGHPTAQSRFQEGVAEIRRRIRISTKGPIGQVAPAKKANLESMDFEEAESRQWRKHQLRRFFQDKGKPLSSSRITTIWKWALLVLVAVVVGFIGGFVKIMIGGLFSWKFGVLNGLLAENKVAAAFFAFQFMSFFYAGIAWLCCYLEPTATGSGIPEMKAFLNGVNLSSFIKVRMVIAKLIGMCFAVASGLPTGKKGPTIHMGATIGSTISQGGRSLMGFDASWQTFQDLRNDKTKRDFATYGLAAGVAAVFRAPIGGCLFALEEGASFWSATLTFRAFFCAMLSLFTVNLLFTDSSFGRSETGGLFVFGEFHNYDKNLTNYNQYELFIFIIMGISGGVIGAAWNALAKRITQYYMSHMTTIQEKAFRVIGMTFLMCCISFILPLSWQVCTPKPSEAETADWEEQDKLLIDQLVAFQCSEGSYNQVASLYLVPADVSIRQLFHFREYDSPDYVSFEAGPLFLFFIPYFLFAACIAGLMIPSGLFVPSILAGAAYGRIWGHFMNVVLPGKVADSGTYALMGAAAINGGITRMTISMTIIMLETAGNMTYLLPLMVTFGAARYTGNAFGMGIYDIQLNLKDLPFLESSLHSLGLLNHNAVTEIMATPVVTLMEIDKVKNVFAALKDTKHNGFPVVDANGKLRGLILRKALTSLLKLKAFSAPEQQRASALKRSMSISHDVSIPTDAIQLAAPATTVFFETVEKQYPDYPVIEDLVLTDEEKNLWLDLRPLMDTSCYIINSSASILRTHREFRTLGMRHLVVLDGEHKVVGMITRKDILDKHLRQHWKKEGKVLEQNINVEAIAPGYVFDTTQPAVPLSSLPERLSRMNSRGSVESDDIDEEGQDTYGAADLNRFQNSRYKEKGGDMHSNGHAAPGYDKLDDEFHDDIKGSGSHDPDDQSVDWWASLGVSRDRKQSVTVRDDFCTEDDRLETEDSPDLEFQDRMYRRGSSNEIGGGANRNFGKWSNLMHSRK